MVMLEVYTFCPSSETSNGIYLPPTINRVLVLLQESHILNIWTAEVMARLASKYN